MADVLTEEQFERFVAREMDKRPDVLRFDVSYRTVTDLKGQEFVRGTLEADGRLLHTRRIAMESLSTPSDLIDGKGGTYRMTK